MPLVVPGLTNKVDGSAQTEQSSDRTEDWTNKLVGKTLHEEATSETAFNKADLPKLARVIQPGQIVTKDFKQDRLNVHVNEDGIITHVVHG